MQILLQYLENEIYNYLLFTRIYNKNTNVHKTYFSLNSMILLPTHSKHIFKKLKFISMIQNFFNLQPQTDIKSVSDIQAYTAQPVPCTPKVENTGREGERKEGRKFVKKKSLFITIQTLMRSEYEISQYYSCIP